MSHTQKALRLTLPPSLGLTSRERHFQQLSLNGKLPKKQPGEKFFADLLKRIARRVMADITECPPDTLPAHLARLDDIRDVVRHAVSHDYAETAEARLSGVQLTQAYTLKDFVACLDITRRHHRAPSFINNRDAELSAIHHKLDLLAGLVSGLLNVETPETFKNSEGEEERV